MTNGGALGIIEAIGLTAAAAALDAALKAADVKCIGVEKVIGVDKLISVTINVTGDVAAVQAAVDSGVKAAERVGRIVGHHVLPRPHQDVEKILAKFSSNIGK